MAKHVTTLPKHLRNKQTFRTRNHISAGPVNNSQWRALRRGEVSGSEKRAASIRDKVLPPLAGGIGGVRGEEQKDLAGSA